MFTLLLYLCHCCTFRIKGEFILEEGKGVDYSEIKGSKLFKDYVENVAPQLQYADLDNMSERDKKAFFISILYQIEQLSWEFQCFKEGICPIF